MVAIRFSLSCTGGDPRARDALFPFLGHGLLRHCTASSGVRSEVVACLPKQHIWRGGDPAGPRSRHDTHNAPIRLLSTMFIPESITLTSPKNARKRRATTALNAERKLSKAQYVFKQKRTTTAAAQAEHTQTRRRTQTVREHRRTAGWRWAQGTRSSTCSGRYWRSPGTAGTLLARSAWGWWQQW